MKTTTNSLSAKLTTMALSSLFLIVMSAKAQLQFSGPANYSVGTEPGGAVTGDFNDDGKLDLAVVNYGSGNVTILLGKGDGKFQAGQNFSAGATPAWAAVGDFNGDHNLDLAVANGPAQTVSILLGNGDGGFQPPVEYMTGISAFYVVVSDFNNDQKADLLVSQDGSIGIMIGSGEGTFGSPIVSTLSGTTTFVAVGDFNGDGKQDVATGNAIFRAPGSTYGNVIVLLGKGDGTFESPVTSAVNFGPAYLTSGDFNGDGKPDLAVVAEFYAESSVHQICTSEGIGALLNNGNGTFSVSSMTHLPSAACVFPAPRNPSAGQIQVSDLNRDGKLDLVAPIAGPHTSSIWAFLGYGNGSFQGPNEFNTATPPAQLVVGDFNGDAYPDLAVVNTGANSVSIYLNAK